MEYESAEQVRTAGGRQYHLDASPGDIAESIVLVGDPDRAARTAERFDSVRHQHAHREYHLYTGVHQGLDVSVLSVGMGAGSMEIAVLELVQLTRRPRMIRCGSAGALQPHIELGDLVVSLGAVRLESASLGYVEQGYPAFAHPEAVMALCQACADAGARFHTGVTATASGFYGAQARSVAGFAPADPRLIERLARQNVLNLEMETSCLLTLAALKGLVAGAVCATFANRPHDVFIDDAARLQAESQCIEVSLGSLHLLARMAEQRGDGPWHPGLMSR